VERIKSRQRGGIAVLEFLQEPPRFSGCARVSIVPESSSGRSRASSRRESKGMNPIPSYPRPVSSISESHSLRVATCNVSTFSGILQPSYVKERVARTTRWPYALIRRISCRVSYRGTVLFTHARTRLDSSN